MLASALEETAMTTLYDMPQHLRHELIACYGKAAAATGQTCGFGGEIVFLDNGENVHPRFIAAKYPRKKSGQSPREGAEAFLREMTLQAQAHYHPNVHWPFEIVMILRVPVAYFRRWEGDLSAFIEDERLCDEERLSIMVQLVAGLAHCQARGLVHQDLKPENVFVRDLRRDLELPESGVWLRPLVADFGSVNLAAEIRQFRGSRPYMAPEQWGETVLSERTNVFAAGIILHELMSRGVHPIGERSSDWHRHINPGFNRWQKNNRWRKWTSDGCPIAQTLDHQDIANLVAGCLAISPSDRPSLLEVQAKLLDMLRRRSSNAADQVHNFLHMAESQSAAAEWQHLEGRIEGLKRAIEEHYP